MNENYVDAIWADYTIHGEVVTFKDALHNEFEKAKFKLDHGTYKARQKVKDTVGSIPKGAKIAIMDVLIMGAEIALGTKLFK